MPKGKAKDVQEADLSGKKAKKKGTEASTKVKEGMKTRAPVIKVKEAEVSGGNRDRGDVEMFDLDGGDDLFNDSMPNASFLWNMATGTGQP